MVGDEVEVAIVGGGMLGASIAWHLARAGHRDVAVFERNALATGATARSAGLVIRGHADETMLRLVQRTFDAIAELETELGETAGFHRVGSIRTAEAPEHLAALEILTNLVSDHGGTVEDIDSVEARRRAPWLDARSARRIVLLPDDGFVDAPTLATAYARAASARGASIRTNCGVESLVIRGGVVRGVVTTQGPVACRHVVLAAGAWAPVLAAQAGFGLATAPVRSHYWFTASDDRFPREHPVVVIPDARAYTRPELGAMLVAVREWQSRGYDARLLPPDIEGFALTDEEDWDHLLAQADSLRRYYPALDEVPLVRHIAGLSTYTPDGKFLLGPAPGIEGLTVASGCCGSGVTASGGIGEAVANSILGREPAIDLKPFRVDRFGAFDPYEPGFLERCTAARSTKMSRTMQAEA